MEGRTPSKNPRERNNLIIYKKVEDIVRHSSENWRDKIKNLPLTDDAVRALFPEILLGVYTDSEIVDALDTDHKTTLNEDGEIIIVDADHEEVQ